MDFDRLEKHQRNGDLERLLKEVNGLLEPVERQATLPFEKNRYPVILIMGCPRSGTTLFLQWLASLGYFSYPTNILSRFYGAPFIGAKIQLMLTQHDFRNELWDLRHTASFQSDLGKTQGALAPHEFWYFWRRFFPYADISCLGEEELSRVNHKAFVSELAAIEAALDKPLALKAMIANWNIPFLARILEKAVFVFIKRHPFYNIQSLLKSRLEYYGDLRGWYSFKPPEYAQLKEASPYEQVAGQVFHTNRAVREGLATLDKGKVLEIAYEEFCRAPAEVFEGIVEKFRGQGYNCRDWSYQGPKRFDDTNTISLPEGETRIVLEAYRKISGEDIAV